MNNKIGVIQGRLVPKYQGRYQAFPIGMWQDEFKVAQEYGLDLIEFILDFNYLGLINLYDLFPAGTSLFLGSKKRESLWIILSLSSLHPGKRA